MEGMDFTYEVIVRLDVTATTEGTTSARGVEMECNHNMLLDDWHDDEGRFTEKGINALLFGLCTATMMTIRNAGQLNGMDMAALFRKAIVTMEDQFVSQAKVSQNKGYRQHERALINPAGMDELERLLILNFLKDGK